MAHHRARASSVYTSTPYQDLPRRTSSMSRKHYYGSMETVNSDDTAENVNRKPVRYRVETGEVDGQNKENKHRKTRRHSNIHLENPESQLRWYFKYFLGRVHQNYVGMDANKNTFLLSVCLTDADNFGVPQYRAILWRSTGRVKLCVPYSSTKPISAKVILQHFNLDKLEKGPKEVLNPEVQKELLTLEEQEGSINFKFGVLFAKQGQISDDEMFSNEHGSEHFDKFLELLGDKITLEGWGHYRGGLDTKGNTTGSHSVHTVYEGHEIMFHVSTLLPYSRDNQQQLERKRHIGNDIVTIVYQECDIDNVSSFTPYGVRSQFIHIYALVTYDKGKDCYKVIVYSEESVPMFGPPLPAPSIFYNHRDFRDFLLVKLINGEKAAYSTPIFARKRQRTLNLLLKNVYQEYVNERVTARKTLSDVITETHRSGRRKEKARQELFLQVGQSLKLKTIVQGDAPTSLVSTGIIKREPWEPECICEEFPYNVTCGDSWDTRLILATEDDGVYLFQGNISQQIMDKSVWVQQLNVVDNLGLLILRAGSGRDASMHVLPLTVFESENVLSKQDLKEYRIEKAKGLHLYSVSRSEENNHLFVCVGLSRKVLLYTWDFSDEWPTTSTDTVSGFKLMKEINVAEVSSVLCLLLDDHNDVRICMGYRNQFDVINTRTGEIRKLHTVESTKKAVLVSAADVYQDETPEMVLTFNHTSIFKRFDKDSPAEVTFQWNAAPQATVIAFPYILAFTRGTIEIRLGVNGNLVHSLVMPKLRLITDKADIYFTSSTGTPMSSPTDKDPPVNSSKSNSNGNVPVFTRLYRISHTSLSGGDNECFDIHIPESTPVPPRLCRNDSNSESSDGVIGTEANTEQHAPLATMSSCEEDLNEEEFESDGEPVNKNLEEDAEKRSSCEVDKENSPDIDCLNRVTSDSDVKPVIPLRDKIKDFKEWEELFKHAKSTPV